MWNLQTGINKVYMLNGGRSFGHNRATYDNQEEMLAYEFDDDFSLNYVTNDDSYTKGKFEPLTWYIKKENDGTIRFQYPTNRGLLEDAKEYNKNLSKNTGFVERSEYEAKDFATEYYEISNANYEKLRIK